MTGLMERIAWSIHNRISMLLEPTTLFRNVEWAKIVTLCEQSCAILERWKKEYLNTRERIEHAGVERRWEFNKNRLFKETDYQV